MMDTGRPTIPPMLPGPRGLLVEDTIKNEPENRALVRNARSSPAVNQCPVKSDLRVEKAVAWFAFPSPP